MGSLKLDASSCACVPFPAPCAPIKTMTVAIRSIASGCALSATLCPSDRVVVAHYQLEFDLAHGVHCHADDDHQTRPAKIKIDPDPRREPRRQRVASQQPVKPVPDQRQILK